MKSCTSIKHPGLPYFDKYGSSACHLPPKPNQDPENRQLHLTIYFSSVKHSLMFLHTMGIFIKQLLLTSSWISVLPGNRRSRLNSTSTYQLAVMSLAGGLLVIPPLLLRLFHCTMNSTVIYQRKGAQPCPGNQAPPALEVQVPFQDLVDLFHV